MLGYDSFYLELITESEEDVISNLSTLSSSGGNNQSLDDNPIRQVTDQAHKAAVETGEENSREGVSTGNVRGVGQNNVKKEISSQHSKAKSESVSEKIVRLAYTVSTPSVEIVRLAYTVSIPLIKPSAIISPY